MLKISNKGQVTIFIVIGAILLLVFAFLFANSQFDLFVSKETTLKNQISDTVERCIEEHALTGIFLLGFQGGHITVPPEVAVDMRRYVDLGFKIPNWDSQRGDIPSIFSMEQELSSYVKEQSLSCIESGFGDFEEALEINYNADEFSLLSSINSENVVLEATFPIQFSERNAEEIYYVEDHFVNLEEIRLGDLYSLALEIYNVEAQQNIFEELVLDQIYSSSDYRDRTTSMPSEGMSITCTPQIWTVEQLKGNLANLNNNNFKYLYFDGTKDIEDVFSANLNEDLGTEDLQDYFRKNYVVTLPETRNSFENYQVDITMPSVEVTGNEGYFQRYPYREFEVTPSSGGLVKPINLKVDAGVKIPIPCIQIYHHLYTLDYDLMVKLTDTNDEGDQFFFQFPLRILIENNNPKTRLVTPVVTNELTATNDAFCSEEERIYPVEVFAKDITYDEFLTDVDIEYKCISLTCGVGDTQRPTFNGLPRQGALPRLEGWFPYCVGGEVIAQKEGYHQKPNEERLVTDSSLFERDVTMTYDVELIPTKSFAVDSGTFLAVYRETNEGARVFTEEDGFFYISFENEALDFESYAIYPNSGDGFLDSIELLDYDDVKYNVSAFYIGPDDDMRGFLELQNFTIDVHTGNTLQVTIPATVNEITGDTYLEFFEFAQSVAGQGFYGINLN